MKRNRQEKLEMEQIKSFDQMRKRVEDYYFLMYSVMEYIFLFIGCAFALLPVSYGDMTFYSCGVFILSMASVLHLAPFQVVREKGKAYGIYEKCKWLPVSRKVIRKVRREYLFQFSMKVGIGAFFCQLFGAVLSGRVGFWNVAFPVLVWFLVLGIGNLYISFSIK